MKNEFYLEAKEIQREIWGSQYNEENLSYEKVRDIIGKFANDSLTYFSNRWKTFPQGENLEIILKNLKNSLQIYKRIKDKESTTELIENAIATLKKKNPFFHKI